MNLPGWYGLGSGLAAIVGAEGDEGEEGAGSEGDEGAGAEGIEVLRRAYREWPLFGVLLDNAAMSLAKTDRLIGARYLALGGRDDLTERVLAEYDLTKRLVLAVTGPTGCWPTGTCWPARSRCVTPTSSAVLLQLRRWPRSRAGPRYPDDERERLERLLLLSVNGVAAAFRPGSPAESCQDERDAVAYAPART